MQPTAPAVTIFHPALSLYLSTLLLDCVDDDLLALIIAFGVGPGFSFYDREGNSIHAERTAAAAKSRRQCSINEQGVGFR